MAIGVALVVVPGQLAKLATVAGAQDIIEGFMPDELESYDEDDFESFDEGEGWTSLPIVNGAMAANGGFAKAQTNSASSNPQTVSQTSTISTVSAEGQVGNESTSFICPTSLLNVRTPQTVPSHVLERAGFVVERN